MCNKHVHSTVTRASRSHCLIDVINNPTTVELCKSPENLPKKFRPDLSMFYLVTVVTDRLTDGQTNQRR